MSLREELFVKVDGTLEIGRAPIPPSERNFLRLELHAEMLLEQCNQFIMILEEGKNKAQRRD